MQVKEWIIIHRLVTRKEMLDTGFKMLDPGYRTQDNGCRIKQPLNARII
jgi:hypothetical protein